MDTTNHQKSVLLSEFQMVHIKRYLKSNQLKNCFGKFCRVRKFTINTFKNINIRIEKWSLNNYIGALLVGINTNPYFIFCRSCVRWLIRTLSGRHSPPPWYVEICTDQTQHLEERNSSEALCAVQNKRKEVICIAYQPTKKSSLFNGNKNEFPSPMGEDRTLYELTSTKEFLVRVNPGKEVIWYQ